MNALQLSGALPRDPLFRQWVASFVEGDPVTVGEAASFIRIVCEVESRRELASSATAAKRFEQFLRRPFVAWRAKQQ